MADPRNLDDLVAGLRNKGDSTLKEMTRVDAFLTRWMSGHSATDLEGLKIEVRTRNEFDNKFKEFINVFSTFTIDIQSEREGLDQRKRQQLSAEAAANSAEQEFKNKITALTTISVGISDNNTSLQDQVKGLTERIAGLERQNQELLTKHEAEESQMRQKYDDELAQMKQEYENQIAQKKTDLEAAQAEKINQLNTAITGLNDSVSKIDALPSQDHIAKLREAIVTKLGVTDTLLATDQSSKTLDTLILGEDFRQAMRILAKQLETSRDSIKGIATYDQLKALLADVASKSQVAEIIGAATGSLSKSDQMQNVTNMIRTLATADQINNIGHLREIQALAKKTDVVERTQDLATATQVNNLFKDIVKSTDIDALKSILASKQDMIDSVTGLAKSSDISPLATANHVKQSLEGVVKKSDLDALESVVATKDDLNKSASGLAKSTDIAPLATSKLIIDSFNTVTRKFDVETTQHRDHVVEATRELAKASLINTLLANANKLAMTTQVEAKSSATMNKLTELTNLITSSAVSAQDALKPLATSEQLKTTMNDALKSMGDQFTTVTKDLATSVELKDAMKPLATVRDELATSDQVEGIRKNLEELLNESKTPTAPRTYDADDDVSIEPPSGSSEYSPQRSQLETPLRGVNRPAKHDAPSSIATIDQPAAKKVFQLGRSDDTSSHADSQDSQNSADDTPLATKAQDNKGKAREVPGDDTVDPSESDTDVTPSLLFQVKSDWDSINYRITTTSRLIGDPVASTTQNTVHQHRKYLEELKKALRLLDEFPEALEVPKIVLHLQKDPMMTPEQARLDLENKVRDLRESGNKSGLALERSIHAWEDSVIQNCVQNRRDLRAAREKSLRHVDTDEPSEVQTNRMELEKLLKEHVALSNLVQQTSRWVPEKDKNVVYSEKSLNVFQDDITRLKRLEGSKPVAPPLRHQTSSSSVRQHTITPLKSQSSKQSLRSQPSVQDLSAPSTSRPLRPKTSTSSVRQHAGASSMQPISTPSQTSLPGTTTSTALRTRSGRDFSAQSPQTPTPVGNPAASSSIEEWRGRLSIPQIKNMLDVDAIPDEQSGAWLTRWASLCAATGGKTQRSSAKIAGDLDSWSFGPIPQPPYVHNLCIGGKGTIRVTLNGNQSSTEWIEDCYLHSKGQNNDLPCCYVTFAQGVQTTHIRDPATQLGVRDPNPNFDVTRLVDANGKRWILRMRKHKPGPK